MFFPALRVSEVQVEGRMEWLTANGAAGSARRKPWVALSRQSTAYFEVKLAADLRRVESLREWRGSGVLSTSHFVIPANANLWSLRRNLAALSLTVQC